MRRPIGLRQQLLLALVVPAFLVLAVIAYLADEAMRRALEDELGARLISIAGAGATVIDARVLLLERGDDEARVAKNARKKLDGLVAATGAARVLVIRLDGAAILDTAGELKIGEELARARFDRIELERVAAGGSAASVLFRDLEGRWYKSGYAPLRETREDGSAGKVVGAVVVEAPAEFFAVLTELRWVLAAIGALGFAALAGLAVFAARSVTTPLSALSGAAERIGRGELATEIPAGGPKEAVVLSETMRRMARSISEREEEMQVMLAGIAHEVRNPLGGIELFGGLLREDLEGDPRKKHVDKILKQIGVLGSVVNDFLDFARKRPLDLKEIDVRELLEEVVAVSRDDAAAKRITLTTDLTGKLVRPLDRDLLHRAVLNLVRNALQATPEGGHVEVRAAAGEGLPLELQVADDGPGIPVEKREEIFRPFFTTKQKGTGLGLALVKKAVEAHHGRISVTETPGGGATFVLSLPVPEQKRAGLKPSP